MWNFPPKKYDDLSEKLLSKHLFESLTYAQVIFGYTLTYFVPNKDNFLRDISRAQKVWVQLGKVLQQEVVNTHVS